MYETTEALFAGICDAIREKDGTTELISHQNIPERITAIPSGGGVEENGAVFLMPVANEAFEMMAGKSATVNSLINRKSYINLRKPYSLAGNGYDSALFKYKIPINAEGYDSISVTCTLGNDGAGVKAKAYLVIADSVPDVVENERYDFSGWELIGESTGAYDTTDEITVIIPLEHMQKKGNLYIGLHHGDEARDHTVAICVRSIILNRRG